MTLALRIPGYTYATPGLKAYRDKLMNAFTEYMFDCRNSYCLNGIADGTVTNGAVMKNMVNGSPGDLTWRWDGGGSLSKLSGANGFAMGAGNTSWDVARAYDHYASQKGFLICSWVKPPATGSGNVPFHSFNGASLSLDQYVLSWNSSNNNLGGNANGLGVNGFGSVVPNTIQQFALSYSVTGGTATIQVFRNGALLAPATSTSFITIVEPTAGNYFEGGGLNSNSANKVGTSYNGTPFTWFRSWKENLTDSAAAAGLSMTAQAAAQVLKDWNTNHAAFGV